MKRTPVLIDVNGVPLRESLSYNGGGAGFGGQMAEWLPPAQSADAALLPALRLGNARADDLVRNNGIAANAVALHKDHIVGHMFLISYRPNWRWLGMRETAAKSFVDEVEAAWSEYAEGMFGEIDVEGKRTFTEFIREGVGVHAFNGEIFVQPVWDTETTQLFRTRFKAVSPKRVTRLDTVWGTVFCGPVWRSIDMAVPSRTISVRMIFRSLVVDDGNGSRVNFPPGVRPCCIFSSRWRTGRPVGLISFTASWNG